MKYFLAILVFVGGMTSLALEMSALRLLGAYLSPSLSLWGCLIGMILLYLTVGYFIDGRLDLYPSVRVLCTLTIIAAISLFVLPFACKPILSWSRNAMAQISVNIFFSLLVGTILLFTIPMTLLGLISPFAIRLMTIDIFNQPYIPFQFTTRAFFLQMSNQMRTSGTVVLNIAHTAHDYLLVQAFVKTMKQVFPSVYTFNVPNSINTEIMATKEQTSITTFQKNLARFSPTSTLGQVANGVLSVVQEGLADGGFIFTDDQMIAHQLNR